MEEWRPIPAYPYEVSNLGRVRRTAGPFSRLPEKQPLRPDSDRSDYLRVQLSVDGRQRRFLVHTLVATAFLGPRPEGRVHNHKNGDRRDNRPENLEYVTPGENVLHSYRVLGRKGPEGSRHGLSILTEEIVERILARRTDPVSVLAWEYGVSESTIFKIRQGRTWRHVHHV